MKTFKQLKHVFLLLVAVCTVQFVSAQSENHSGQSNMQEQPIDGNSPAYLQSVPFVKKTANGGLIIDNTGTVQITENGVTKTISFPVPVVDREATDMWAAYPQWEVAFKEWMVANPDFENYLSAAQREYFDAGDVMGVYKVAYYQQQNTVLRNQLNQTNHE